MRQEFNQNPQNIQIHQVSTSTSAMSLNSNPIVSTIIPEGHESSIPGSRLSRRSSHGSFSDGLYSDFSESEGQPKGVPSRLSSPGDNSTTRGRSELRSELLRRHEFRCQSLPGFERVCKTRSHIHPGIESETQFSMCQIAPIPGKGLGTIATRDIRQGILILEETPLATVQNQDFFAADGDEETDNMVKDIVDSVKRLSIQQRYEFLQLYRFFPDSYSEAFKQSPAPYNSDESIDIIAKFLTNSFGDTKHADVLKVLTLKASRLNHSCSPNATWRYNRETNKFQIRANQDIASGSEVTIVYSCLLEPRKDRQAKLERGYGFVCECIACDLHSEYGIATENRRKQIQQLFRRLDIFKLHPDSENKQIDCLLKILECLEDEPSMLYEKFDINMKLAELHESENVGLFGCSLKHWNEAREMAAICLGPDHPFTQDCQYWGEQAYSSPKSQQVNDAASGFNNNFGK